MKNRCKNIVADRPRFSMLYMTVKQIEAHAHESTVTTSCETSDTDAAHGREFREDGSDATQGGAATQGSNHSMFPGLREDTADSFLLSKRLLTRQHAPPRAKFESTFLDEVPLRLDFSRFSACSRDTIGRPCNRKMKPESPI